MEAATLNLLRMFDQLVRQAEVLSEGNEYRKFCFSGQPKWDVVLVCVFINLQQTLLAVTEEFVDEVVSNKTATGTQIFSFFPPFLRKVKSRTDSKLT